MRVHVSWAEFARLAVATEHWLRRTDAELLAVFSPNDVRKIREYSGAVELVPHSYLPANRVET